MMSSRAAPLTHRAHALWQRQFGGTEILRKGITLHGKSYTVVGVMPPGFSFPDESELWIPMTVPTTRSTFEPFRGFLPSHVIATVRPEVSLEAASAQVLARWRQVAQPARGETLARLNYWIEQVRAQ